MSTRLAVHALGAEWHPHTALYCAKDFALALDVPLLAGDVLVRHLRVFTAHLYWSTLVCTLVETYDFRPAEEINHLLRKTTWMYKGLVNEPGEKVPVGKPLLVCSTDELLYDVHRHVVRSVSDKVRRCEDFTLQVRPLEFWDLHCECLVILAVAVDMVSPAFHRYTLCVRADGAVCS